MPCHRTAHCESRLPYEAVAPAPSSSAFPFDVYDYFRTHCCICFIDCENEAGMLRHMALYHIQRSEGGKYECMWPTCNQKLATRDSCRIHFKRHLNIRDLFCPEPYCDFRTGDNSSLTRHKRCAHKYQSRRMGPVPRGDGQSSYGKRIRKYTRASSAESTASSYSSSASPSSSSLPIPFSPIEEALSSLPLVDPELHAYMVQIHSQYVPPADDTHLYSCAPATFSPAQLPVFTAPQDPWLTSGWNTNHFVYSSQTPHNANIYPNYTANGF